MDRHYDLTYLNQVFYGNETMVHEKDYEVNQEKVTCSDARCRFVPWNRKGFHTFW